MSNNVFHLSHIDLDGYGCQYLTNIAFDNIRFYNANYGPEVSARLKEIILDIKNANNATILITDLNLTPKEAIWIEKEAREVNASLILLDHHITGKSSSEKHEWYHLDISHCGTWLTYDWLQKNYNFDTNSELKTIVDAINDVDMWHSKNDYFEYGKVMMSMISSAKEINRIMFQKDDINYKHFLIDSAKKLLSGDDANIKLDDNVHALKKEFFMVDKNDTKDNLIASYVSSLLSQNKDRFTINYKGYKGLLGYNIGNSSIIGNTFLVQNPDFNFYMDVNFRGIFSLRGNDTLDLSQMAGVIGNGGGHKNASGGKIEEFRDSFVYEDIKDFVQRYINDKSFGS
ncbi:MAG: phosphoesterase [Sulfurovaceae bacterium]|nr:phosphoesterase [Sulfurovaceae bacterium]MDD5548078.1 phosphoesterase [Sulfurovaceae bacterium]